MAILPASASNEIDCALLAALESLKREDFSGLPP